MVLDIGHWHLLGTNMVKENSIGYYEQINIATYF